MAKPSTSELAVLRSWIVGVPANDAVSWYLEDFQGNAQAFIRGWLEKLALKAKLLGKPGWARLLFQRQMTEEGQREAVRVLEKLTNLKDPTPEQEHPLDLWLPSELATSCLRMGFKTLGDLVQGWRTLSGHTQQLIYEWLVANSLLNEENDTAEKESSSLVVTPIERLLSPKHLDGSLGSNRAPGPPKINAANDYEAVQIWLSLWPEGSHTYKAYRREAERFLLWCLIERGKAFSSVNAEDCIAYRNFLKDPMPTERWIGPVRPRSAKDWKPFQGPLSNRSVQQAEIILSSLCQWLVGQYWLDSNSFSALPKRRMTTRMRTDHALTEAQWQFALDYADQRIKHSETEEQHREATRLRFVLEFAYLTGLRISELAAARIGDIEPVVRRGGTQYWLIVRGKGDKERSVPLPQKLMALLVDYLRERGWVLDHIEQVPPETPIIVSVRRKLKVEESKFTKGEAPVTPLTLHHMIRAFFKEAGAELAKQDPAAGKRLSQGTAHWLRHTHGSHALDRGIPITVVRDNLGHASIQTTSLYLHKDADERFAEMEKLTK